MSGTALRALAPAKLNLFLEVLGKRDDGFHELDTVMVALDRADALHVRPRAEGGVELALSGSAASEDIPRDADNLVVRAVAPTLERAGRGARIELDKRIPSRAGLGGGSADAAAALVAVRHLLGTSGGAWACAEELARLGSDCAFFVDARESGCARCTGRGELVEPWPVPDPSLCFAVFVPALDCPTGLVYGKLPTPASRAQAGRMRAALAEGDVEALQELAYNRLEEGAVRAVPELRRWRALCDAHAPRRWILSGSGSAFFGVFSHEHGAQSALMEIEERARQEGLLCRDSFCSRPNGMGASIEEVGANRAS